MMTAANSPYHRPPVPGPARRGHRCLLFFLLFFFSAALPVIARTPRNNCAPMQSDFVPLNALEMSGRVPSAARTAGNNDAFV